MKKILIGLFLSAVVATFAQADMEEVESFTCDKLYSQAIHNYKNAFNDKHNAETERLHVDLGMFTMELYKECIRRQTKVEKPDYSREIFEELRAIKRAINNNSFQPSSSTPPSYDTESEYK